MEKASSRRWSSGGAGDGHQETLPLRGGLETERAPPHEQEAGRGRYRRNCVRAALVLCLLTLPAGVLLIQRWRASSSPEWLFEVELPTEDDDEQGTDSSAHPVTRIYVFYSNDL